MGSRSSSNSKPLRFSILQASPLQLGRIKTPDARVLRHVESKITARRMGGKRSPREPDLGDDRATQNVAEPGSPRGPAPGTAGTRGPTSRIPPQAALHPRVPVLRPVTPVSSGPALREHVVHDPDTIDAACSIRYAVFTDVSIPRDTGCVTRRGTTGKDLP